MLRLLSLTLLLLALSGCGQSPQEKYDAAVRELERRSATR